jgi:hypothetical protein
MTDMTSSEMRYWYISIVNVAVVYSGAKPARVPCGFYGALIMEVDPAGSYEQSFSDSPELCVIEAAQKKFDIPQNCQCEVLCISEMPPKFFRERLLSKADLALLDDLAKKELQ